MQSVTRDSELDGLVDWFITTKRIAGRAPRTLNLYERAVRALDSWLSSTGRPRAIEQITSEDLASFFLDYAQTHAPNTCVTLHAWLRSFWKWAMREELITVDVMLRVPAPHAPETSPHVVTDVEFAALLSACRGSDYMSRRDEALLRLLDSAGLRRAEAVTAKLADLNWDTMTLRVMGKGSRPRTAAFDDETYGALRHYTRLRARHPHHRCDELFLGRQGPLRPNAVTSMMYVRARQAGLTGLHPHLLRHRFADRMKRAGMSDESLRALGGWSSSQYLERYGRANRTSRAIEEYQRLRRSKP